MAVLYIFDDKDVQWLLEREGARFGGRIPVDALVEAARERFNFNPFFVVEGEELRLAQEKLGIGYKVSDEYVTIPRCDL